MNKPWKVILAFLGVFLAGAVFGGFISMRAAKRFMGNATPREPGAPGGQFSPQILKRLTERLRGTPEQQEKMRPILKQTEEEMRRLRQAGFRETIAVAEHMNEQMAALLTPEQKTKLDAMHQEMRERWSKDRTRRWGERAGRAPGERPPGGHGFGAEDRPEMPPKPRND